MPPKRKKKFNIKIIKEFTGYYKFLSNFCNSPIQYKDKIYPTAEHLYQALKTKDESIRDNIRTARTPIIAKNMGRCVKLRDDWEEIKDKLMYMVVRLKFIQNGLINSLLCNTGDTRLIEGNYWHDNYWGNCTCLKCNKIQSNNQLGKTLMKVRIVCRQKRE